MKPAESAGFFILYRMEPNSSRMKHKKTAIGLVSTGVILITVGAILNCAVVTANGGMPSPIYSEAAGKWVPLTSITHLPVLADVIPVWQYALSIGDVFFIIGMAVNLLAVWVAFRPGRIFFPLLVISIPGIFLSGAVPGNQLSTTLFMLAAIGTLLAIYWKYRRIEKISERKRALEINTPHPMA